MFNIGINDIDVTQATTPLLLNRLVDVARALKKPGHSKEDDGINQESFRFLEKIKEEITNRTRR